MRIRYAFLVLALFFALVAHGGGAADAGPAPLVVKPEPLPGRFTGLSEARNAWLVHYGSWSEWGGTRPSALRLDGRWHSVPAGAAYAWRTWLVFDGLTRLPRESEADDTPALPPGATLRVFSATEDIFARRVMLFDREMKRRVEAPWDTFAPLPLGDGRVWLLWQCRGDQETRKLELVAWTPGNGRSRSLGTLVGTVYNDCELDSSGSEFRVTIYPDGGVKTPEGWKPNDRVQAVVPSDGGAYARMASDGGEAWVFVDASGRVHPRGPPDALDGGTPLQPFRAVSREAVYDGPPGILRARDGREVHGALPDGGSMRLNPSLVGGIALHQGFLFTDEGVFRWPRGEPPPRMVAEPEEVGGGDGGVTP